MSPLQKSLFFVWTFAWRFHFCVSPWSLGEHGCRLQLLHLSCQEGLKRFQRTLCTINSRVSSSRAFVTGNPDTVKLLGPRLELSAGIFTWVVPKWLYLPCALYLLYPMRAAETLTRTHMRAPQAVQGYGSYRRLNTACCLNACILHLCFSDDITCTSKILLAKIIGT